MWDDRFIDEKCYSTSWKRSSAAAMCVEEGGPWCTSAMDCCHVGRTVVHPPMAPGVRLRVSAYQVACALMQVGGQLVRVAVMLLVVAVSSGEHGRVVVAGERSRALCAR